MAFDSKIGMEAALALTAQGRYTEAMPLLDSVLAADPDHAEAHFWTAQSIYLTGGPADSAFRHFEAAGRAGFDPFRLHLNRGIARAETGQIESALADFHAAVQARPDEPLARQFLEQTQRTLAGTASARDFYYLPPHVPHLDADWLETCSIPQSMQFMVDCLPVIRRLMQGWTQDRDLEVLDVGTASAAGPALLSRLHSGRILGPRVRVDAIDLIRRYRCYAQRAFPLVNYICGDLFQYQPQQNWDLVLSSHTIEHLTDPTAMIRHCQQRARHWALFYAPYQEMQRIPGHLGSITPELIATFEPIHTEVMESCGWKHPTDLVSRTVLFVLPGRAVSYA